MYTNADGVDKMVGSDILWASETYALDQANSNRRRFQIRLDLVV